MTSFFLQVSSQLEYEVLVRPGALSLLVDRLRSLGLGPRLLIITDQIVNRLYGQDLQGSLQASGYQVEIIELPSGEQHKNFGTLGRIYGMLQDARVDRGTVVLSLGGGVVGDVAGLVAATWQRGLPLLHLPTTLLAQVDSSLGGKAAVNHLGMKNLIGAFKHPRLVLSDPNLLPSLPEREFAAGMAELVKTALLAGPEFWSFLLSQQAALAQRQPAVLAEAIIRAVAYKGAVVGRDPEDLGERQVLNFGHTIGHVIEELAGQRYNHGEAVSVGLCLALEMSVAVGLPQTVFLQAEELLRRFGLPTRAPGLSVDETLKLLVKDKKAIGGVTRWVLLRAIGQPFVTSVPPNGWMEMLVRLVVGA